MTARNGAELFLAATRFGSTYGPEATRKHCASIGDLRVCTRIAVRVTHTEGVITEKNLITSTA
jgi:hypothetical protein